MDNTTETHNKRNYDWLKQYQFKKWNQAAKGKWRPVWSKSLKVFVREYITTMSDEEKLAFLETMTSETIWKMAEGNPHQTEDITSNGESLQPLLVKFIDGTKGNADTNGVQETVW